ncbi:MAG: zinc-dependent metalloprotease, partial [Bdellovibrionota bacterium]|nr:zinc-dependent metalloprotease [Bdellovibrionota bacterium]
YHEAIKEGVLYWNKALGKDLINVIMAPEGVTAPHPDYNIIQWVNWDLAGFAYADAQMDPRSGQILHAQVFLTSSFAFGSIEDARRVLDSFKEKKKKHLSLKGFQKEKMCSYHLNRKLKRDLERLLETAPTKKQLLKVSRDYVAELVAHEVGHTLGLRHNFAGSLGQNFSLKERKEIRKNYFKKGEVPSHLRTTTSVMDYQLFLEGSLTGHFVRKGEGALEYDKVAMQKLYLNKKLPEDSPLFCTDGHRDAFRFHDCDIFDVGNNFVQFVDWWLKDALEVMPQSLIRAFVRAKVGGLGREPRSIKEVVLSPKQRAEASFELHHSFVRAFTQEGRFLRIHRLFPAVGELEKEEMRAQDLDYLADQCRTEDLFPRFGKSIIEKELLRFEETLERMSSGLGPLGRPYQFNSEELAHIKKKAKRFYVLFEKELQKKKLFLLKGHLSPFEKYLADQGERSKKAIFEDHPVVEKLVPVMEKAVKEVLFTESDEVISTNLIMNVKVGSEEIKKVFSVDLPHFIYDHKLRSEAASLMGYLKSKDYVFGHFEKAGLKKLFKEKMKEILNGQSLDKVELGDLSKNAYRWVLKNKKILSTLSK